jgi:hypothetical protein
VVLTLDCELFGVFWFGLWELKEKNRSIPVADATVANFPNAVFTVETLNPVWVYCRQTGHCQQGMVFASEYFV